MATSNQLLRAFAASALVACTHDELPAPQAETLPSVPARSVAPVATARPSASSDIDVTGSWTITDGQAQGGSSYSGTVTITRNGLALNVAWDVTGTQYTGVGLQYENRLYVGWGTGDAARLMVYRMQPAGSMLGEWVSGDAKGLGTETATGSLSNGVGAFTVSGTWSHKPYGGKLAVTMDGDAYKLDWTTSDPYYGTGLADGDRLGVGFATTEDVGYAEYVFDGNTAKGRWTWRPTSGVFVEDLEREHE